MSKGYVYVLSNPVMPGLYKIGKTTRDPNARANELYQTGVPAPFKVEHSVKCPDCDTLEYELHQCFEDDRLRSDREFFTTNLGTIIQYMDDWRMFQVRELISEFMPDHYLAHWRNSVPPDDVKEIAKASGCESWLAAFALQTISAEEMRPAIDRAHRLADRARAEGNKPTALTVVSSND